LQQQKKIYFISDLHFGTPDAHSSRARELKFVQWMEDVSVDAAEIFIVGDLFDFWHEYGTVVPKGFVRVQAAIAKAVDAGIKVSLFTGNHDLWQNDYFEKELGVTLYREPIERTWNGKQFLIGHGDGLGPGDHGYKFMKKVFTNPLCQWLFKWLHPDLGMQLAGYFSYKSRYANGTIPMESFQGEDKEWLIQYCKRKLQSKAYNYFIFGHRHLPIDFKFNDDCRYINTGDWLSYYTYAVFDGTTLELKTYGKDS
jgi:UDP-2,3-diacylglucosamine hydrolase